VRRPEVISRPGALTAAFLDINPLQAALHATLLALLFIGAAAVAQEARPVPVAFVGGAVLDPAGKTFIRDAVILVDGERIAATGPAQNVQVPANAQLIRLQGRYIIPGLVNSHVHLATLARPREAQAYLRRELYSGVTAVRDMAGDVRLLGELKREAAFGEIAAPDIFYAALMAGPSFFKDPRTQAASHGIEPGTAPWMRAVTDKTDLRLAVAEARGTGATAIKIYANLEAPLVRAITAEAHRQHLLVWAHAAVFPASPLEVAQSGVDVMSHSAYVAYQATGRIPPSYRERSPIDAASWQVDASTEELFRRMKDSGIVLDATVNVAFNPHSAKWPAALVARVTREAYQRGVLISAGTDDGPDSRHPDSALLIEISHLVHDVGMTPADALRAATLNSARTVGAQGAMGSIEPRKQASFVVLGSNPLEDIANLQDIVEVVKRGRVYSRRDYHPAAPGETGLAHE
jgi:imidazolonepropionase-like amidohydrolase